MWHLIEDFFEQPLIMMGFIGLVWLAVLIMLASFVETMPIVLESLADTTSDAHG